MSPYVCLFTGLCINDTVYIGITTIRAKDEN